MTRVSLAFAGLAASSQPLSSATRDGERGRLAIQPCAAGPCGVGCWCPFDSWQEVRLLKFGYGMTSDREVAASWCRRAAEPPRKVIRAAFN